jgi:hypothetical protein
VEQVLNNGYSGNGALGWPVDKNGHKNMDKFIRGL